MVFTAFFILVILGITHRRAPGLSPLAIGLALTLIHLVSIPVTNTSVNPARSTAVAFSAENWAVRQLWLFWVAPLVCSRCSARSSGTHSSPPRTEQALGRSRRQPRRASHACHLRTRATGVKPLERLN